MRWVSALVVLLWFGVGGTGGPLVGRLSEVATNDNANFLPPSAESTMPEKTGSLGIDGNGSQSIWPSRAISATVRPSPIAPYERRAT